MHISITDKINIFGTGVLGTLLIILMIEAGFAQFLTDLIIGHLQDNVILLIIILGLFLMTSIISIIVGYYLTGNIQRRTVLIASLLSFISVLLFLFILANITLFIYYTNIYNKIHGFDILIIFPQVLIYFGVFILGNIFYLFILEIVLYYGFFIVFLEQFYEVKYPDRR